VTKLKATQVLECEVVPVAATERKNVREQFR
jgi:hypothetical protein